MSALDTHIGNRLRQLRIKRRISLAKAGEIIEVTPQQVHRYEQGKHRLAASSLYRLARGLDMPITWFFQGYEENPDELKRLTNMGAPSKPTGSHHRWEPGSLEEMEEEIVQLWRMLPTKNQQIEIVRLLEAFT